MASETDYLEMQRGYYNRPGASVESLVGFYDFHEAFPYETLLLYRNGDLRRPLLDNLSTGRALDVGCGEGRMVRRMQRLFAQVDGADLSEKMLAAARAKCPDSTFYLTSGKDCGEAPSGHYDFAYCTISLQHVCSYAIRRAVMLDAFRTLRVGGCATFQLLASRDHPYIPASEVVPIASTNAAVRLYTQNTQHAGYFDERLEAQSTNSGCDGLISFTDVPRLLEDFGTIFQSPEVWFWDISVCRSSLGKGNHPNAHMSDAYWGTHFVFLHGRKL
jgi:SAM-dependent methyltransferase